MSSPPRGAANASTITAVALKAKVAPMTVSRVINGGYVSAEVRTRVEKVIKELGYAPSTTARSLRSGKKGCIGVCVESVLDAWFMGLYGGIEPELNRKHLAVMLASMRPNGQPYDASTVWSWINGRRVDGLILVRFTEREQPLLDAARAANIPVAFICPDQSSGSGFTVRCRNYDAGKTIATYLLGEGHRHFNFVGGPKESEDSLDRLRGLREVLTAAGAPLSAADISFQKHYWPEAGRAAALSYLKRPAAKRASAVVLGNDSMALAFIGELLRAGVRVPEDVSVTGFDGIEEGERSWPTLTTVAQPMRELGAAACKNLLSRIEEPSALDGMTAEFPMQLIVRESTGRAPSRAARSRVKLR